MKHLHIAEQGIDGFLQGKLSPHENQRIVRHLLAGRVPEEHAAAVVEKSSYDALFENLGTRLAEAEARVSQER